MADGSSFFGIRIKESCWDVPGAAGVSTATVVNFMVKWKRWWARALVVASCFLAPVWFDFAAFRGGPATPLAVASSRVTSENGKNQTSFIRPKLSQKGAFTGSTLLVNRKHGYTVFFSQPQCGNSKLSLYFQRAQSLRRDKNTWKLANDWTTTVRQKETSSCLLALFLWGRAGGLRVKNAS